MFYLIFGLLILAPRRWSGGLLAGWTAAVVGRLAIAAEPTGGARAWMPLYPVSLEFLSGCLAAAAFRRRQACAGYSLMAGVVCLAASLAWIAGRLGLHGGVYAHWRGAVLGPPIALSVYGLAGLERTRRLSVPTFLCRIGDASYSIYLTHQIVGMIVIAEALRFGGTWPLPFLAAAAVACVQVGVGWLCYRWIEAPLLRLARWRLTPRGVAGPSSTTTGAGWRFLPRLRKARRAA